MPWQSPYVPRASFVSCDMSLTFLTATLRGVGKSECPKAESDYVLLALLSVNKNRHKLILVDLNRSESLQVDIY